MKLTAAGERVILLALTKPDDLTPYDVQVLREGKMGEPAFSPGDVVVLKSGGPRMTVSQLRNDGCFVCLWFMGEQLQREAFLPQELSQADFGG